MVSRRTTRTDRDLGRSAMSSSIRSATGSRSGIRPPSTRPSNVRQAPSALARLERAGAISPAESVSSATTAGTKRKERDFETENDPDVGGEGSNINVVVRCRGRNEREIKENSTVMVETEGVKGKAIGLSMGPNALSNKTYSFDRVFSAAADQSMIFDDTVRPILEEVRFYPVSVACFQSS
jgi:kinesin family member 11